MSKILIHKTLYLINFFTTTCTFKYEIPLPLSPTIPFSDTPSQIGIKPYKQGQQFIKIIQNLFYYKQESNTFVMSWPR